ncbi:MAG: ATP-binding protein [Melioribacteraceae bacterium]|nr:ATP-binding protein [Melioribacteraceae bacterium]
MIKRKLTEFIKKDFFKNKAIIIYGARQVGKTTLLNQLAESISDDILWLNGDEPDIRSFFEDATSSKLKLLIAKHKFVFIDEAQRIENIGIIIKLIVDNISNIQLIATGSSAFELSDKIKEPLTGRKFEFTLYPISYEELVNHFGIIEARRLLEFTLQFGSYPEVVNNFSDARRTINLIADSYLYKDLFTYEGLKRPNLLLKISQALALQVGNEVSYSEIAQLVNADKNTVDKYVHLLELAFIIFRLPSLSRNMRNEIKRGKKIYFWDVGIRNALISNFSGTNLRTDIGAVWENYFISERLKFVDYNNIYSQSYFWRTKTKSEIDYIEERENTFYAFELKWNPKARAKIPNSFLDNYTNNKTYIVTNNNFDEHLL